MAQHEHEEVNYKREAARAAARMALYFIDEIVEQILKTGRAGDNLYNDFKEGEEYHQKRHLYRTYTLREAADVIDQLVEEYEADDRRLWQGKSFRETISTMAAYTYANAVYELWRGLIERINMMTVDEHEQHFKVGPKEWSPHGTTDKLKEFVKDFITTELEG